MASPGGQRHDRDFTADQKLIDSDPDQFSVHLLTEWKAAAEQAAAIEIGKTAPDDSDAGSEIVALLKKFSPEVSAEFFLREGFETLQAADPSLRYESFELAAKPLRQSGSA